MSRTKIAVVWCAWSLFGVLAFGGGARASEKAWAGIHISSIEFKGAEHFSATELQQCTNLAVDMPYDDQKAAEDCAAIVRHYQEHGYPFATCTHFETGIVTMLGWMNRTGGVGMTHTINEGPKVKVEHVEFVGNQFVGGDVLLDQLECHKRGSSRTNFAVIQTDVIHLTEYYRSFGYLDVSVNYELQWNLDGGDAVIMFHINEGERYKQP